MGCKGEAGEPQFDSMNSKFIMRRRNTEETKTFIKNK